MNVLVQLHHCIQHSISEHTHTQCQHKVMLCHVIIVALTPLTTHPHTLVRLMKCHVMSHSLASAACPSQGWLSCAGHQRKQRSFRLGQPSPPTFPYPHGGPLPCAAMRNRNTVTTFSLTVPVYFKHFNLSLSTFVAANRAYKALQGSGRYTLRTNRDGGKALD